MPGEELFRRRDRVVYGEVGGCEAGTRAGDICSCEARGEKAVGNVMLWILKLLGKKIMICGS